MMEIQWVFLIAMGIIILMIFLASKFSKNETNVDVHTSNYTQSHAQFMPGLLRADVEEQLSEVDRWECVVCAFSNFAMKATCSLCGAGKESNFMEQSSEEIDYTLLSDRPRSKSYRDPSILRASMLSMRGSKGKILHNIHRMSSFFFHKLVLPEDLNPRQRSARMRKEWVRKLDTKQRPYWKRRILDSSHVPLAFLVQFCTPSDQTIMNRRQRQSTLLGTLDETEETIVVLEEGDTDIPDELAILQDQEEEECTYLTYLSLDTINANRSILGKVVDPSLWPHLHMLSRQPFSSKYMWYLHQSAALMEAYDKGHCKMRVSRDHVFDEAMENILYLKERALCSIIRMQFAGESGLDAGAIQREWYLLAAQGFMDDASGLFMLSNRDDNSYFINPNSEYLFTKRRETVSPHLHPITHAQAFQAAGRFIGRALLDGQMLPLHFSPVLFKLLLGIPVTLDDVESLDKTIYSSMRYILDNDNVDDLCLTFSATEMQGNHVVEIDLIDNGRDIAVTDQNKLKYVDLMTKWLLFDRIKEPLQEMILGLYEIVPPELLIPFDHKEFELILCGLTEIDMYDWKSNTITSLNLHNTLALEWFWEVVESMSSQNQAKLLQYSTGSSRVPVQGFKGLTSYDGKICYFTLKGVSYVNGIYPCVHACYNRIDLPLYPSRILMEDALNTLLLSDPIGFNIE